MRHRSVSKRPGIFTRIFSRCQKKFHRARSQASDIDLNDADYIEQEFQLLNQHFSGLGISQDFMLEMRDVFQQFDKDNNGYICSRELASVLRCYGCNPTEQEVFALMAVVDVNHNGKIDLFEFVLMMHNNIGDPDPLDEIRIAFRAFDTNGDGKISKEEFQFAMMNIGEKLDEGEILELFRNADIDSDGSIDLPEFLAMITNSKKRNPGEILGGVEYMKKEAASEETQTGENTESGATLIENMEAKTEMWRNTVRDFRKQGNTLLETDL